MGLTLDENLEPSWKLSAVSGGVCGAVGAFLGSPLNLVKAKLQILATPEIAVGYQHNYRTTFECFRGIYTAHGLRRGLWRAATANIIRLSVGSAVQMAAFVHYKHALSIPEGDDRDAMVASVLASLGSSVTSAPFIAALEMVKTRMYLQPVDKNGRGMYYSGFFDCIRKIYTLDGVRSYMRGWSVSFTYSLLNSAITLVSWEELKRFDKPPSGKPRNMSDIYY